MMKRRIVAVAALLLAAPPAFAAGTTCTRGVQDGSGFHLQSFLDEAGASPVGGPCVGSGPFDPAQGPPAAPVTSAPTTGSAIAPAQVTIGTTATQVAAAASGFVHREFQNTGTATVWIGGVGVTTQNGYPVSPSATYDFSRFTGALYAVAAATQPSAILQY